jgi:hypothetical protein
MSTPVSAVAMAEAFIFQKLAGDTTIAAAVTATGGTARVFEGHAPEGTSTYPVIAYAYLGGADVVAVGGHITTSKLRYRVLAATPSADKSTIDVLAQRIGQVLHLATMQFTQGYINACFRLFPLTMVSVDSGREFRESGFVFEVHVCEQNQ